MKAGIHPDIKKTTIVCACGNRIDTTGRSTTLISAHSRDPSGSRTSSHGCTGSNGREDNPAYVAAVRTHSISSVSESATGGPAAISLSA